MDTEQLLLHWARLWVRIEEYVQNDDEAWEFGETLEKASMKALKTSMADPEQIFRRVVDEYTSALHEENKIKIWQDGLSDCVYLRFNSDSPMEMGYSWEVALHTLERLVSDHIFDFLKRGKL